MPISAYATHDWISYPAFLARIIPVTRMHETVRLTAASMAPAYICRSFMLSTFSCHILILFKLLRSYKNADCIIHAKFHKKSQMRVNESLSTLVSQQERLLIYLDRLLGDKFDDGFEKRILLNRKQFGGGAQHHDIL